MGDLAAQWDTLGWVKFRQGEFDAAVRYLESAWYLMQASEIGDHLAQAYEQLDKKQQAARTYAMVLSTLGPNADAKYRQKITSRLASLTPDVPLLSKNASKELQSLRTYRILQFKGWGGGYKSAEFGIAITKGPTVQSAWHRSGAEELKAASDDLSELKFRISFPDDGPTRIVRIGILSCSEVSKGCMFALIPVVQPPPSWLNKEPGPAVQ